jgi:hypothetical protein
MGCGAPSVAPPMTATATEASVTLTMVCWGCKGTEFALQGLLWRCTNCGSHTVQFRQPPDTSVTLTDEERIAISTVVHQNYYMPNVFAVVERIIQGRLGL